MNWDFFVIRIVEHDDTIRTNKTKTAKKKSGGSKKKSSDKTMSDAEIDKILGF